MNKKTSITVLTIFIVAAMFLGVLLTNKGDGPVVGMILANKAMESTDAYNNAEKAQVDGKYMVVSNAFNKFQEDYKVSIPANKDLYATVHLVECPKGSEYTGKWIKDGTVIHEEKGTLLTGPEGVISYMIEGNKVVKGSYAFTLFDGDKKIFEKTFSIE